MLKDFTNVLKNDVYRQVDEFLLGFHLIEDHRCGEKSDFENSYKLFTLNTCNKTKVDKTKVNIYTAIKSCDITKLEFCTRFNT